MEGATAWLQKRADTLGQTLDMHYAYSCEEALGLPPGPDFDLVLLDYHLSSSADDGTQLTIGDVARVHVEGIDRERAYFVGPDPAISIRVDRSASGDGRR